MNGVMGATTDRFSVNVVLGEGFDLAGAKLTLVIDAAQSPQVSDLYDVLLAAEPIGLRVNSAQLSASRQGQPPASSAQPPAGPAQPPASPAQLLADQKNCAPSPKHLVIDGCLCEADMLLGECPLFEGAEIRPAEHFTDPLGAQNKSVLAVVGGLECAEQTNFGFNQVVVGRHHSADLRLENPAISLRHLSLYSTPSGQGYVSDLDSVNRNYLESPPAHLPEQLLAGRATRFVSGQRIYTPGAVLESRHLTDHKPPPAGRSPLGHLSTGRLPKLEFKRPPRPEPPPVPPTLKLPDLDSRQSQLPLRPPTWATFAVPLAMGIALAVLFSPYMALFALLGPAMAVTTWLEGRGRSKKEGKQRHKKFKTILADCETFFHEAAAAEVQRRRFEHPDPAETLRWAELATSRLWSRRNTDHGFLLLAVGRHHEAWQPAVQIGEKAQQAARTDANSRNSNSVVESTSGESKPTKTRHSKKAKTSKNLALADEVAKLFKAMIPLQDVPLAVDFSRGTVGIAGVSGASVLRWVIMQAVCRFGPADLELVIPGASTLAQLDQSWDWLNWLPHVKSTAVDSKILANGASSVNGASPVNGVSPAGGASPANGVSPANGASLDAGRRKHTWLIFLQPPKQLPLLPQGISAVILSPTTAELPPACEVCIEVLDGLGRGTVRKTSFPPAQGEAPAGLSATEIKAVSLDGIRQQTAANSARRLARWEDPLEAKPGKFIPEQITLAELLRVESPKGFSGQQLSQIWAQSRQSGSFVAPIGSAEDGLVCLDLPTAGPHALVAGTTGSGKSELLRCIVVSLAIAVEPERLNFVLIDYKGGSAFDICSELPHVVGLVTDLDEHLGERALTCLRAELAYRERFLRSAGVSDVAHLAAGQPGLPRLVVIVDEFASLANELPTFLESLVGIAQRGRSLGVHLLLATQRPAGVVSPEIRSNTNIRIGLRMLDSLDSQDVLGTAVASDIPQGKPGRGYIRVGAGEAQPFQVASVSSTTSSSHCAPVEVRHFKPVTSRAVMVSSSSHDSTDLTHFIRSAKQAWELRGSAELRCPWPEPLPEKIAFHTLAEQLKQHLESPSASLAVPLGLADLPKEQTQRYFYWQPCDSNLFCLGQPDSGAGEAMLSAALLLCQAARPKELHLHGLNFGAAGLSKLAALKHAGTIASQSEPEKCIRLLDFLFAELAERQAASYRQVPKLVLLIDNLGALWHFLEAERQFQRLEKLIRLAIDGTSWEMSILATAESLAAVSRRMLSSASQQLLFQMPNELDYSLAGVNPGRKAGVNPAGKLIPGRAFLAASGIEIQTPCFGEVGGTGLGGRVEPAENSGLDDVIASLSQIASSGQVRASRGRGFVTERDFVSRLGLPKRVAPLPKELSVADLGVDVEFADGTASIPLGLGYDHVPVELKFPFSRHAIVCGRPRSGKSSTLKLMSQLLAKSNAQTVALCPGNSPLATEPSLLAWAPTVVKLLQATEHTVQPDQPVWLLMDETVGLDDTGELIPLLLQKAPPIFHLVVAGTPDYFRAGTPSWLQRILADKSGVLLSPSAADYDLLEVSVETASYRLEDLSVSKGRALVVNDGQVHPCQLAKPDLSQEPCQPQA